MNTICEEILLLLERLIEIPSVSGDEAKIAAQLTAWMQQEQWRVQEILVEENRNNLFVSFGSPEIVFTTHMDVVPASSRLFKARRQSDTVLGRGACDAKGSIATMLILARELLAKNYSDFGLLFVVGEEIDGIGAKVSAEYLKNSGIKNLLNGEPTEGRFATATKGVLDFDVVFSGRSCHSGYPAYGQDANKALIEAANKLYCMQFGSNSVLGEGNINIGKIEAGSAANVISSSAQMSCCIRTIEETNDRLKAELVRMLAPADVIFSLDVPAISLSVPSWESQPYVAAYVSDVGHFSPLNCSLYLCGPGSILNAHTDEERISKDEIATAYSSYLRLFDSLYRSHSHS